MKAFKTHLDKALSNLIQVGSAFSTGLEQRPPEILSNLSYSIIFTIMVMDKDTTVLVELASASFQQLAERPFRSLIKQL